MIYGWVYRFVHRKSGLSYVGSTVNLNVRIREHLWQLRKGVHCNDRFQKCWSKYGEESFDFEVLEEGQFESDDSLRARENDWFHRFDDLLNLAPIAGTSLGVKHSPETVEKIRKVLTGRKRSAESRALMSRSQRRRDASTRNLEPLIAGAPKTRSTTHRQRIGESNSRRATRFEVHGVARTLPEWAAIAGVHRDTLAARLKSGWSMEKALTTRKTRGNQYIRYESDDQTKAAQELACSAGYCEVDA